jgi:tryptophan synthase alpha chain
MTSISDKFQTLKSRQLPEITRQSRGFIYLVSVTGVTGMRSHLQNRVQDILTDMHSITKKPIGVGFGISSPEQAQQVKDWGADAVIVGSAFVNRLATDNPTTGLQQVGKLCQELKLVISH